MKYLDITHATENKPIVHLAYYKHCIFINQVYLLPWPPHILLTHTVLYTQLHLYKVPIYYSYWLSYEMLEARPGEKYTIHQDHTDSMWPSATHLFWISIPSSMK